MTTLPITQQQCSLLFHCIWNTNVSSKQERMMRTICVIVFHILTFGIPLFLHYFVKHNLCRISTFPSVHLENSLQDKTPVKDYKNQSSSPIQPRTLLTNISSGKSSSPFSLTLKASQNLKVMSSRLSQSSLIISKAPPPTANNSASSSPGIYLFIDSDRSSNYSDTSNSLLHEYSFPPPSPSTLPPYPSDQPPPPPPPPLPPKTPILYRSVESFYEPLQRNFYPLQDSSTLPSYPSDQPPPPPPPPLPPNTSILYRSVESCYKPLQRNFYPLRDSPDSSYSMDRSPPPRPRQCSLKKPE